MHVLWLIQFESMHFAENLKAEAVPEEARGAAQGGENCLKSSSVLNELQGGENCTAGPRSLAPRLFASAVPRMPLPHAAGRRRMLRIGGHVRWIVQSINKSVLHAPFIQPFPCEVLTTRKNTQPSAYHVCGAPPSLPAQHVRPVRASPPRQHNRHGALPLARDMRSKTAQKESRDVRRISHFQRMVFL